MSWVIVIASWVVWWWNSSSWGGVRWLVGLDREGLCDCYGYLGWTHCWCGRWFDDVGCVDVGGC